MAQHKWHKEIKAWADGEVIQYKDGRAWWDTDYPEWDNEIIEYRIKPQPKEPHYLYVAYLDKKETWDFSLNKDLIESSPIHTYIGKIKLEEELE